MKIKIKKPVVISGIIFLGFGAFLGFSAVNQNTPENSVISAEERRADLFIVPEKGTFIVDEGFQISLNVDTNIEINAASSKLYFPVDKLEVIGLSKEESIFEFWIQEPSYSNTIGTIQFGGGLPTPGFKGSEGKILTMNFRPKQEGKVEIRFGEGLVLADDGKGTNILKAQKSAFYELRSPIPVDLNGDGSVGLADLSILLSNWGIPKNPKADINKDSKVDITDFSILLFNLVQRF